VALWLQSAESADRTFPSAGLAKWCTNGRDKLLRGAQPCFFTCQTKMFRDSQHNSTPEHWDILHWPQSSPWALILSSETFQYVFSLPDGVKDNCCYQAGELEEGSQQDAGVDLILSQPSKASGHWHSVHWRYCLISSLSFPNSIVVLSWPCILLVDVLLIERIQRSPHIDVTPKLQ